MTRATKTTTKKADDKAASTAPSEDQATPAAEAEQQDAKPETAKAPKAETANAVVEQTGDVSNAPAKDEGADMSGSGDGAQPTLPATGAEPGAQIRVVCHREDGRRRAGRRWDHGETLVDADALSTFELQVLRADPLFTVQMPTQEQDA